MTLTFENDNDVIVYALEKIISYARKNQYIFVAQSAWWLAATIGLTEGLVTHIDNLRKRSESYPESLQKIEQLSSDRKVSPGITESVGTSVIKQPDNGSVMTPRDIQDPSNTNIDPAYIHPDRRYQVNTTTYDSSRLEHSDSESDRAL